MLLVIDIGNTNSVLGLFDGKELVRSWRTSSDSNKTEDEYQVLFSQLFLMGGFKAEDVTGVTLASVVPPVTAVMERTLEKWLGVKTLVIGPGVKTGMPILYDNPREVGADRIVNAVAAYERIGHGVIVVDFGTATTFDCVSPKGEYLGGVISPGIQISAEALFVRASKLPRIEISFPKQVLAKNTVDAMQSGITYGYADMVDGILRRLSRELDFPFSIMATGGLARAILKKCEHVIEIDDDLTLHGLRLIHERNEPGA
jgi:type III pantothenate kinase